MSAMFCSKCGGNMRVVETFSDVGETHRLRRCCSCDTRILTCEEETAMSLLPELYRYKRAQLEGKRERKTKGPASS